MRRFQGQAIRPGCLGEGGWWNDVAKSPLQYEHRGMNTARERLSLLRKMHVGVPGTQISERPTETTIMVDCIIEITDALLGSEQAINDMANRVVTVSNNMTGAIDKAREQMEQASRESTKAAEESINAAQESAKAAKESANLARKLNMLTVWIAIAAIVSALSAIVQAGAAWRSANQKPQPIMVQVAAPSQAVPSKKQ